MLSFVFLVIGFALMIWGADKFVAGASALARKLGVSPLLIGLTIVAFGTSMPGAGGQVSPRPCAVQTRLRSAMLSARTFLIC